jgi:YHS domain-containing protein
MLATVAGLAAVITLVGCKKKEQPAAPPKTQTMGEMKQTATKTVEEVKKTVKEAAAEIEQTMCPIMDGNKIDKNVFVEYKGKKVYFCCADCKAKFEAEPGKYIAKLPQFHN